MDRMRFSTSYLESGAEEREAKLEAGVLRKRLIHLTLDWDQAARTLDEYGYKAETSSERESLRERATVYRKCIAEITEVLAGSSVWLNKRV